MSDLATMPRARRWQGQVYPMATAIMRDVHEETGLKTRSVGLRGVVNERLALPGCVRQGQSTRADGAFLPRRGAKGTCTINEEVDHDK